MTVSKLSLNTIGKTLLEAGRFRIVFLGDSITSAEWVHPNWREAIEYVLKEELAQMIDNWKIPYWGVRCINSGFDGATTYDFLECLGPDVLFYKPDLVIFITTANDMHSSIDPEIHKKNIVKLTNSIPSKSFYLVAATSPAANSDRYNKKYSQYARKVKRAFLQSKVQFVDLFEKYQRFDLNRFFTFVSSGNKEAGIKKGELDFIHPNILGNAYIAKILLKEIFLIDFDPEVYTKTALGGKVYPEY